MPSEWLAHLEEHVPFFDKLNERKGDVRERFLENLKVFVWEKVFIGAGGLEMTDEVKVVIAATAVRLVQNLDLKIYDDLTEIVVYPYDYTHGDGDGMVLGEAHTWGTVVLSWPSVLAGLKNPEDGHDTATHEFAHVLDIAGGSFDGTPPLRSREDYGAWAKVLSVHYYNLQKRKRKERKVLREYGATNEAEFFAVATESFFEKPKQMKEHTPELYEELKAFYGLDPAVLSQSS